MDIWHDDEGVWAETERNGVKELLGPFKTEKDAEKALEDGRQNHQT